MTKESSVNTNVSSQELQNDHEASPPVKLRSSFYFRHLLSTHLHRHLYKRDHTRKELAVALGVEISAITRWKKGERIPKASTIFDIAKKVGLEGEDKKHFLCAWLTALVLHELESYAKTVEKRGGPDDMKLLKELISLYETPVFGDPSQGNDIY
jgi:transcriptional regulator with XRE-family HTH domain